MYPECNLTTELSGRPRPPCRGQTRPTMFPGPLERIVRCQFLHFRMTPRPLKTITTATTSHISGSAANHSHNGVLFLAPAEGADNSAFRTPPHTGQLPRSSDGAICPNVAAEKTVPHF